MKELFEQKINQLRRLYKSKKKNGLLIENQNNFAWLLGGRTFVGLASVKAVVDLLINDNAVYLLSNNIETRRMLEEEFPNVGLAVREYPWFDSLKKQDFINELTDGQYLKDIEVEQELLPLRINLTEEEGCRLKDLGGDAASAMDASCLQINRGMSEKTAVSIMAKQCYERDFEPNILLVAADERIQRYRHPLPTAKTIEREAMLVIGGRRNGQCVGLTRYITFSEPSQEMLSLRDSTMELYALLFEETRPGQNLGIVFRKLLEAYKTLGYPAEWKQHHQGGVIGYNPREVRVDFDTNLIINAGQAYAWNPSLKGFKAEDTFIVGDTENQIITYSKDWPSNYLFTNRGKMEIPDIFVRKPLH
ncbi:hypothetical protein [Bacillus sp. B15-48]|uniref:M24 family metallopeptidase n=1 Tax=Bacillus sp. B15-48 TaxID=1548601 RepID=UPI00193EE9B6|nr:hypothetical protein [Bacillus sp. B15-48]MBM4761130.1 hypothetical protein [Bacillus sp. B15-48]